MASDRDTLAADLDTALAEGMEMGGWFGESSGGRLRLDGEVDLRIAAAELLTKGWRPPARLIKTIEQLDALPVGSLVGDTGDPRRAYIRNAQPETRYPGWTDALDANTLIGFEPPVLLLWEPKAGDHA